MTVLELAQVTKTYPGNPPVSALRSIELSIQAGELIGVVGPSGSGKSTLLQLAGTLEMPTSGLVRVAGADVSQLSDRDLSGLRACHIGFVFQQFFLLESLSALDNVAAGLIYRGEPRGHRLQVAAETLARVGLGHRLGHRPSQLSGGERQRVAIARALVGRPSIVLADEPTGNLDSIAGAGIIRLLRDLNAEGTTILMITHSSDLVVDLPRRVELLDGQIKSDRRSP